MESQNLILFGYWRSSASWRVRWALTHKKISYESVPVNLLKGEHRSFEHLARNPSGFVPTLCLKGGTKNEQVFLSQSMAIVSYLEDRFPEATPLFPQDPLKKAHVLELCEIINADTAPLQKPMVAKKYSESEELRLDWTQYWIREGLSAFDKSSGGFRGDFSNENTLSAADMWLVPQIYNALRYKIDVAAEFPALFKIYEKCLTLESCHLSSPEMQKDAAL